MNWAGLFGRLSENHIDTIFNTYVQNPENAHVFLCGPLGMMQKVESKLDMLGITDDRRYKESFVSSSSKTDTETESSFAQELTESKVTITLDDEDYEITVKPNEFILETALDAGIDMPFSCQSGLCTACRGKLISGE